MLSVGTAGSTMVLILGYSFSSVCFSIGYLYVHCIIIYVSTMYYNFWKKYFDGKRACEARVHSWKKYIDWKRRVITKIKQGKQYINYIWYNKQGGTQYKYNWNCMKRSEHVSHGRARVARASTCRTGSFLGKYFDQTRKVKTKII
jgi:hypothetical protein